MKSALVNIGQAAFLGCSWTWCIGMFLPVLLVRDLGFAGWIAFAVPNVIGAAAMGWIPGTAESSRRLVELHAPACRLFSIVTIAFQIYFVLWFVPRLAGMPWAASLLALAAIELVTITIRPQSDWIAAILTWLFSIAMFGLFVSRRSVVVSLSGSLPPMDAVWLGLSCLFGFALCPYLDLTFHQIRRQAPSPTGSKLAFGLGFGLFFATMIGFSLVYAAPLAPLLNARRPAAHPVFGAILAGHIVAQAAFTLAVHGRSLTESRPSPRAILGLIVAIQIALLAGPAANFLPRIRGLDAGEVGYWLFMAFYGLIFPGYVWVRMLPRRRGAPAAPLTTLGIAIVIAIPMFWAGYIEGRMVWLVPGVAILVLARYAGRSAPRAAAA